MTEPISIDKIQDTQLRDALSERYLSYALSTIVARSLPDVRDGLKPVHRRLLYAMRLLKLNPDSGFKKCARVVGDVMGKFHPHGDQAIYDAMVRLAQDFAVRYPLVEGQGNFGNIDGDNAAAMRYTEARLTEIANLLLDGIEDDAIDFRETYDGEENEPVILPSSFPNLLANGATGIAVGMATNIPPHNAAEVCDALIHIIKTGKRKTLAILNSHVTFEKLCELIPGPDFPTGGVLVEPANSVIDSYRIGRGSFRIRARWKVEKLLHGQYQIAVSEIPYQVQKARLIEKIADLLINKKIPLLNDIRDESDDEIRIILIPKQRSIDANILMEYLFRETDMEIRFNLNMNVLNSNNTPSLISLREALTLFLEHREIILTRRTEYRLSKINDRLEILSGLLVVFLNLDEIIHIIRENDNPKTFIIEHYNLTERQAEAILNMRLRQLRKLEEIEIQKEENALKVEQENLDALLENEVNRWKTIELEIKHIQKVFSKKTDLGYRRTEIGTPPVAIVVPLEAMIEKEPVTIVYSEKGWIRSIKGHLQDLSNIKFKEGDRSKYFIHAETTDKLLAFSTNGRFYTLNIDRLPGGRGHGEPIRLMVEMENNHEFISMLVHRPNRKLFLASDAGRGFIVLEDDVLAQTKNGKLILNMNTEERAAALSVVSDKADHVAILGTNKKLLIFPINQLPKMGRGKGVILQRYKNGKLSDVQAFKLEDGISWKTNHRLYSESKIEDWIGKRGSAGMIKPRGFPSKNRFYFN